MLLVPDVTCRAHQSVLANHDRKHPPINLPASWLKSGFTLEAEARGKEMRIHFLPKAAKTAHGSTRLVMWFCIFGKLVFI